MASIARHNPGRMGWLVCGLLCVSIGFSSYAADPAGWFYRPWETDDGLPDNTISGIAQTPDGFLWVATYGGLERFDGVHFEDFHPERLPGVPNRVVQALFEDHLGRLWLGMNRGPVISVQPDSVRVYTTKDGLPDLHIIDLCDDAQGAIWVGYDTGGAARISKDGKVTVFGAQSGLMVTADSWVASDQDGKVWCASWNRLGVFEGNQFHLLQTLSGQVTRIARARTGGMWVCNGDRLLKCDASGNLQQVSQLPARANPVEPSAIFEDRGGAVWIGTAANGLFRYDGTSIKAVPTSHQQITFITEDRESNIWVGTAGGGVDRLRPRPLELIGTSAGLPFESVRSVTQDTQGRIWAVTQNGLIARRDGDRWTNISTDTNWTGGHAYCVAADPSGGVWIGTRERGLYRFEDGHYRRWQSREGLAGHSVLSLLVSSDGDVWIAEDSPMGLQVMRDGNFHSFDVPPDARIVRALTEDSAGRIWVGTAGGSLWRVSGNSLVSEPAIKEPRPLSIRCLQSTPDGSVWIGYAGWGVGWFRNGRYVRLGLAAGLYDDYISQIVPDGRGKLWFAGNRGIFEVDQASLEAVGRGESDQVRSIVFGRGEGLPSLQANFDSVPNAMRSRNGRIWFSMRTGLAVVHPENIRDTAMPPPVILERVVLDGKVLAMYDSDSPLREPTGGNVVDLRDSKSRITLPPGYRHLEFHFTALSFTAPPNVHFRYRLEPFDDDWIEGGTQRSVSYGHVPAGKYKFVVRACNNVGIWNTIGDTVNITVRPFFWQSWWFRFAALAVFTLMIIAAVRYVSFRRLRLRMHHLEQQAALNKERARIAKDIHDDVGANLTQIALLGELAQQDSTAPEKSAGRIDRISSTARQAVRSLDEIVWAVNPRNDTLAHLIDYAGQYALDYLRVAGIRCRLDFPETPPSREVSTEVRHNLFLVVKEALNNLVKHANATEVWFRINADDRRLSMSIEDNGRGFNGQPSSDPEANGLRNMRQRIAEIGGEYRIESRPGGGTRVSVELLWRNRMELA